MCPSQAVPPPSTARWAPVTHSERSLGEEEDGIGDVLRRADPRDRPGRRLFHERLHVLAELDAFPAKHGRIDVAGADAIDSYVVLSVVDGHGSRQVEDAPLAAQ